MVEKIEFPEKYLSIAFYSTVSTDESVYIIGGRRESQVEKQEQYTDVLAQYKDDKWILGTQQLQYQRVGHASILIKNNPAFDGKDILYIFGGSGRNSLGFPV